MSHQMMEGIHGGAFQCDLNSLNLSMSPFPCRADLFFLYGDKATFETSKIPITRPKAFSFQRGAPASQGFDPQSPILSNRTVCIGLDI
jgi:hypothetical protein